VKTFLAMTRTFFTDNATLMSPRTAKYVDAMIQEGDNFDYNKWLKEVREEEVQGKQVNAMGTLGGLASAQIAASIKMFDDQHFRPKPALPLTGKATLARALPSHRQAKSQTPKARLRRWLEKVRGAWEDFQSSRSRDAVYGYLEAVFAIVAHFRVRRRAKRLLQDAFKFADLPCDKRAHPFAAIIRCTSDRHVDSKTVSKWSRALRFAAAAKKSRRSLKQFMKKMGGINACAARYAGRPHKH
jgi:hypothetical protein